MCYHGFYNFLVFSFWFFFSRFSIFNYKWISTSTIGSKTCVSLQQTINQQPSTSSMLSLSSSGRTVFEEPNIFRCDDKGKTFDIKWVYQYWIISCFTQLHSTGWTNESNRFTNVHLNFNKMIITAFHLWRKYPAAGKSCFIEENKNPIWMQRFIKVQPSFCNRFQY